MQFRGVMTTHTSKASDAGEPLTGESSTARPAFSDYVMLTKPRIIELLLERGVEVSYNDPYVPQFHIERSVFYHEEKTLTSQPLTEELVHGADCVVVVAGHTAYDYPWIARNCGLLVDSVNATAGVQAEGAEIVRLGTPGAAQGRSVRCSGAKE